jgi:hypothetical protein
VEAQIVKAQVAAMEDVDVVAGSVDASAPQIRLSWASKWIDSPHSYFTLLIVRRSNTRTLRPIQKEMVTGDFALHLVLHGNGCSAIAGLIG